MPPLIRQFFSIPDFLWKTEELLYKDFRFGPLGRKISTKPWCPPPPMRDIFRWKNFSETPNCSPLKNFGTVRQKLFLGKSWFPPPLLPIKDFSLPEVFCGTEWFLGKLFSVLWDKKSFDKTLKLPPPLLEIYRYQKPFETQKGSYTILSALWDSFFQRSLVISPSYA